MANSNPAFKYFIYNADGVTNPWQIYPSEHELQFPVTNDPATARLTLLTDFTNVVANYHEGAQITIQRDGDYIFRGTIREFGKDQTNNPNTLVLSCLSKDAQLDWQMAQRGQNQYVYSYASNIVHFTAGIPLALLTDASAYNADVLYPAFPDYTQLVDVSTATSPYIGKNKCHTTTILANVNNGAAGWTINDVTHPILVSDFRAIQTPCIVQIGTELLWVNMCYPKSPRSGNQGYMDGITRGILGSTKAAHSNGDRLWERELKPMANESSTQVYNSGVLLDPGNYIQQFAGSRFDFLNNPASMTLTAIYSYYDTDNATTGQTLGAMIKAELKEAAPGPALTDGQIDITAIDVIRIARMVNQQPAYLRPVILQHINEWFTAGAPDSRFIGFDYNPNNDKVRLYSATQKATPDWLYWQSMMIQSAASTDNLHNQFLVTYTSSNVIELTNQTRCWHPQVGDQVQVATPGMTNTNLVLHIMYLDTAAAPHFPSDWTRDTSAGHNLHTALLFDGDPNTGWGIRAAGEPAFNVDWPHPSQPYANVLFLWFTAASVVQSITIDLDIRYAITTGEFYLMDVIGYDAYTPGDPPVLGNRVLFPGGLGVSQLNTYPSYKISADGINQSLAAIAIRTAGGCLEANGDLDIDEWFLIRSISIRGVGPRVSRTYFVNGTPTGPQQYLAPGAVTRLGDPNAITRAELFDAGAVTEIEALRKGRELATKELALNAQKKYVITSDIPSGKIPLRGDTAQANDAGVATTFLIHGVGHKLVGGLETLELTGVDYTSGDLY